MKAAELFDLTGRVALVTGAYVAYRAITERGPEITIAFKGAGGLEAGITVLTIKHQVIPPTINHEVPDPECDLDYVPGRKREASIEYALSNSFGFGGTNGALLFRQYSE